MKLPQVETTIANNFNKYFCSIARKIKSDLRR